MKALELPAPAPAAEHPLRPVQLPDPVPGPEDVLVEVTACGICRTDLHIVLGELRAPVYPVIPGHEAVGRIVALGSRVRGHALGDRVGVAWLGRCCGICRFCRSGRENLCDDPTFTGFHRPGGYAEKIAAHAEFVHRIPESLPDDAHVAPLLCAGIIGYRALRQSGYRPGASLALYGFGAAAHIALQVAVAQGSEVFVVSRGEDSLARARGLGAAWTGGPGARLPRLVEHAVSFAPVGSVIPDALRDLEKGGALSIAGIYLDRIPELEYATQLFGEKRLVSTTANTREDARELLEIAARERIRTDIEVVPLDGANDALDRLDRGTLTAQAAVIDLRA